MSVSLPLHPFLLAACPILALYQHNLAQLRADVMVVPLLLAFAGTATTLVAVTRTGVGREKAALLTSWALVGLFSFGHAWNLLCREPSLAAVGLRRGQLLGLWVVMLVAGGWALAGTRRNSRPLTSFVNAVAVAALALFSVGIVRGERAVRWPAPPGAGVPAIGSPRLSKAPPDAPDIYYIVLDSYGGQAVLQKLYGFTNSEFLEQLRRRGFVIPARSRGNYDTTFPSLPSSLNMEYVNQHFSGGLPVPDFYSVMLQMMHETKVEQVLSRYSYRCLRLGRPREQTGPDFLELLKDTTALYFLDFGFRYRQETLRTFEQLSEVAGDPGPKFVFAYFLPPHHPFVFDRNGQPFRQERQDSSGGTAVTTDRAYLEQLLFVNERVLRGLDEILSNRSRPCVVVLQGDHGPPIGQFGVPEGTIRERMDILNAYLVPEALRKQLYDGITPVNSFRLILNHFFQTGLEPLPDRSYALEYSPSGTFTDVTELVR